MDAANPESRLTSSRNFERAALPVGEPGLGDDLGFLIPETILGGKGWGDVALATGIGGLAVVVLSYDTPWRLSRLRGRGAGSDFITHRGGINRGIESMSSHQEE